MGKDEPTREELLAEVTALRRRVAELEFREADFRHADELHRDDRARLMATIESLPFDFFALGPDGRYVLQNSVCREHGGNIIGLRPEDIAQDEETRHLWSENNRRALAGEVVSEEAKYTLEGRTLHVFNIIAPVRDGDEIRGVVGVNVDITDLKQAQAELEQSESRYRSLVENALHGYFMVDVETREIVFTNEQTREMFGYRDDATAGGTLGDVIAPEDLEIIEERISKRMRGEKVVPRNIVVTALRRDGTTFRAEVSVSMVMLRGRPVLQGLVRDITEEERLTQQLRQAEKLNALGLLAGGIAHDFSNLLHAILGYTQLIGSRLDDREAVVSGLKEIEHLSHQAGELTRQVLTFSRRASSRTRGVDLNRELMQVEKLITRTLSKNIDVRFDLESGLSAVQADPAQIEQVVMNLAVNARDAMPDGGRLSISTSNVTTDGGRWVELRVEDSGTGMSPEIVEHAFEPFFTTKGRGQGTGLGLAVVYGIVQSHDGQIRCESEPGRGTRFTIRIPARQEAGKGEMDPEEEAIAGGTETILVVDDEEPIRRVTGQILESHGYRVITAENGRRALARYRSGERAVDLVVMDMIMPEMDGEQCLGEILDREPGARVIIACGQSVDWTREDAIRSGARGIIRKPFDSAILLREIRRVLDAD